MEWLEKLIALASEHPEIALPMIRWIVVGILGVAAIMLMGLFL